LPKIAERKILHNDLPARLKSAKGMCDGGVDWPDMMERSCKYHGLEPLDIVKCRPHRPPGIDTPAPGLGYRGRVSVEGDHAVSGGRETCSNLAAAASDLEYSAATGNVRRYEKRRLSGRKISRRHSITLAVAGMGKLRVSDSVFRSVFGDLHTLDEMRLLTQL